MYFRKYFVFLFAKSWCLSQFYSADYIINEYLPNLAEEHGDVVKLVTSHKTWEQRDIVAVSINFDSRCNNGVPLKREKTAILIECGKNGQEWISPATCLYIIESLLTDEEYKSCNTDWYIIPLLNPDGYDYTFTNDRLWSKNRQPTSTLFCPGIYLNSNFDKFFTPGLNHCDTQYAGSQPFEAIETAALAAFQTNLKGYFQSATVSINDNGSAIRKPWKGNAVQYPPEIYQENVPSNFYYWNDVRSENLLHEMVEFVNHQRPEKRWTTDTNNQAYVNGQGDGLDWQSDSASLSFQIMPMAGDDVGSILPENKIDQAASEVLAIVQFLNTKLSEIKTHYTVYPYQLEDEFVMHYMDDSTQEIVLAIKNEFKENDTVWYYDPVGYSEDASIWSTREESVFQGEKQVRLSVPGDDNCIDIRYSYTRVDDEKNNVITNCVLFRDKDYWWGGSSLIYMAGGLQDNRDSESYAFEPKDKPWNWGGLIEPYWIGQNNFGAQSVHVNNTESIPLFASVTSNITGNLLYGDSNRQLCISSNYENSEFNRNSEETIQPLKYQVCLDRSAEHLQRNFFSKVDLPNDLPDRSMIYDPIFSTWAIYKQSINEELLREFFEAIKSNGYRASNIEIDDGYEVAYGDHSFDEQKFPNIKELIEEIHQFGANVTLWVTPFINPESFEFDEVLAQNCFVKGLRDGQETVLVEWWDGDGGMIDFTNPECSKWFADHLQSRMETYGVDGFKFDAGEVNYLLENFTTEGNVLRPVDWTMAYDKTIDDNFGGISEVRSAWANQKASYWNRMFDKGSHWSSVNGLQTLVPHAILSSLLGYQYILPDMVGGNVYDSGFNGSYVPDKELFIRWLQISTFLPSIQYSISPWQYEDEEVSSICKYWTDFHRTVIAPIYEATFETYISGESILPIVPVSFFASQAELDRDMSILSITQQFVIAEKYLVAPAVNEGQREIDVYLPDENACWEEYFTGVRVLGGSYQFNTKIGLSEVSFWIKYDAVECY